MYKYLDGPEECYVTSASVVMVEGDMFSPVFCDGHGNPAPVVTWWRADTQISEENTLDFTDPVHRYQIDTIYNICFF